MCEQKERANSYLRPATALRCACLSQELLLVKPVADVRASSVRKVGKKW